MKQLETQVQTGAFTYEIIERSEFNAIQMQKCRESGKLLAFEVFRINKNKEREFKGALIPASETRPTEKQFGISAWCYSLSGSTEAKAMERAKAKFSELEHSRIQKQSQQHEGEIQPTA